MDSGPESYPKDHSVTALPCEIVDRAERA